jgi:hypothetical protein
LHLIEEMHKTSHAPISAVPQKMENSKGLIFCPERLPPEQLQKIIGVPSGSDLYFLPLSAVTEP